MYRMALLQQAVLRTLRQRLSATKPAVSLCDMSLKGILLEASVMM